MSDFACSAFLGNGICVLFSPAIHISAPRLENISGENPHDAGWVVKTAWLLPLYASRSSFSVCRGDRKTSEYPASCEMRTRAFDDGKSAWSPSVKFFIYMSLQWAIEIRQQTKVRVISAKPVHSCGGVPNQETNHYRWDSMAVVYRNHLPGSAGSLSDIQMLEHLINKYTARAADAFPSQTDSIQNDCYRDGAQGLDQVEWLNRLSFRQISHPWGGKHMSKKRTAV